jgi:zinc ribbon protein
LGCGKKRYVRYKDNLTGDYLPEQFGRCDREIKCGVFREDYRVMIQAKSLIKDIFGFYTKQ